ncbi:unnamed protein product, partial [Iphiclides podalirius]
MYGHYAFTGHEKAWSGVDRRNNCNRAEGVGVPSAPFLPPLGSLADLSRGVSTDRAETGGAPVRLLGPISRLKRGAELSLSDSGNCVEEGYAT